jgi:hypothetical protein
MMKPDGTVATCKWPLSGPLPQGAFSFKKIILC